MPLPLMFPFVTNVRCGAGTSMEKLSLEMGNSPPRPLAEVGEASGEEDIKSGWCCCLVGGTGSQGHRTVLRLVVVGEEV